MTLGRLFAGTDFSGAERKILPGKEANCRDDVHGHDGVPLFTTLSLLSFVSFVRLAISSVPKPDPAERTIMVHDRHLTSACKPVTL